MEIATYVLCGLVAAAVIFFNVSGVLEDDSLIEELAEELIDEAIDQDLDLSPLSRESNDD